MILSTEKQKHKTGCLCLSPKGIVYLEWLSFQSLCTHKDLEGTTSFCLFAEQFWGSNPGCCTHWVSTPLPSYASPRSTSSDFKVMTSFSEETCLLIQNPRITTQLHLKMNLAKDTQCFYPSVKHYRVSRNTNQGLITWDPHPRQSQPSTCAQWHRCTHAHKMNKWIKFN